MSKDVNDIGGVTEQVDVTASKDVTTNVNNNDDFFLKIDLSSVARDQNNVDKGVNDLPEGPTDRTCK